MLCDSGVEFIIVGGTAAVLQGVPISTSATDTGGARALHDERRIDRIGAALVSRRRSGTRLMMATLRSCPVAGQARGLMMPDAMVVSPRQSGTRLMTPTQRS